jgi:hypothetical protein
METMNKEIHLDRSTRKCHFNYTLSVLSQYQSASGSDRWENKNPLLELGNPLYY